MSAVNILYIGNKLTEHGFTPGVIETLGHHLELAGIKVYYSSSKLNKERRLLDMILDIIRLRKKVDYVLIDTYSTSAFWYAFIIGFICQIINLKYIPVLHGGNLPERLNKSVWASNRLFKKAHVNVAVSGYLYNEFTLAGYSTVLVPNSIDIEQYPFTERKNPKPKLLWVRSFHKQYNPLLAADVFAEVLKSFPDAELCMVGPDKDGTLIKFREYATKKGIVTKVKITGLLSKKEWTRLSEEYDIFLNTTNVDNTPVSVIEAMALGLAVVSTNVGGIPFLLKDKFDSLQSSVNDCQGMVNNILTLLTDNQIYQDITQKARIKAESYSWDNIKPKWLKLLF